MVDIEASLGLRLDGLRSDVQQLTKAQETAQAIEREATLGRKVLLCPIQYGTVTSNAFKFGGEQASPPVTPLPGYIWNVRAMWINGLTASASTPDVCDIYVHGIRRWQLNGNEFAQTWSMGEMPLFSGDAFLFQNNGTTEATGPISAQIVVVEVPAEMQGKIF